jgi:hypothetical protein
VLGLARAQRIRLIQLGGPGDGRHRHHPPDKEDSRWSGEQTAALGRECT